MSAALAGLFVGGLLGGVTVAAFNDLADDGDRYDVWMEAPGWGRHHDWGPGRMGPECYAGEDHGYCVLPPPAEVEPVPEDDLLPEPTYTG
uniref:Uncharacterized protein n=2 Tax=Nonomuraea gerenzanensis TaxID=93944 RepID=A0A1M4E2B8_9ACTN|nr:hypothetical protein BN4615_P2475 [Nonomuraea gerenzanensis]